MNENVALKKKHRGGVARCAEKSMGKNNNDSLVGSVFTMAGLVQYQKGSVVSRTLIDKPSGTVTLFAFDAGQGLSEHTAPFDAFVYIAEGSAQITIAGTMHALTQGQMIIMPAGKPHALTASVPFKMALVMIRS